MNISSRAAQIGSAGEWVHYAASKGAIDSFTIGLAREVAGEGIRVNAVAPGFTATEMVNAMPQAAIDIARGRTPVDRLGLPWEIARVVRFLVDENSGFITGATYDVNGGMYM